MMLLWRCRMVFLVWYFILLFACCTFPILNSQFRNVNKIRWRLNHSIRSILKLLSTSILHASKNVQWWSIQRLMGLYLITQHIIFKWWKMETECSRLSITLDGHWATRPNRRDECILLTVFVVFNQYCLPLLFPLVRFFTIRTHCSMMMMLLLLLLLLCVLSLLFICTRNYRYRLCSAMNYGVARDQSMITYSISTLNFFPRLLHEHWTHAQILLLRRVII